MAIMKDDEFRKLLKKGATGGYFFFGDEDYMKNFTIKAARDAICPDPTFAVFNDIRMDSLDYSPAALLDALIPPPMMSEQKIITVSGLNIDAMRSNEISDLAEVLKELERYDYNLLIISIPADQIDIGNPDKGRATDAYNKLSSVLTPVRFDTVTGTRLTSWVGKHFEHNGVSASPAVCASLIDYCGRSMYTLSEETNKLAFYVLWNGRDQVTAEDIKNISIAEISVGAFELSNAIAEGRSADALKALSAMKFRRDDPIMIMSEIVKTVYELILVRSMKEKGASLSEVISTLKSARISEFVVKRHYNSQTMSMKRLNRIAELCSEADMELKNSSQSYLPIERLICNI